MNCLKLVDSGCCIPAICEDFHGFDADQIIIWGARIDQMMETITCLEVVLSEEERHKARHFYFRRDQWEFVTARGLLRLILGQYLDKKPTEIAFTYNAYGKPSIAGSCLKFNISHSGNRVILGFVLGRAIGVDIEEVRTESYDHAIAQQHFMPREIETLEHYPDQAVTNFFTYWTCKEAVLKGMGSGIAFGFPRIDLSCMDKKLSSNFEFPIDGIRKHWTVTRLTQVPGYVGAVALNGSGKQLVYREITKKMLTVLFRKAACL